jgi:AraC-like DNA-binding protein
VIDASAATLADAAVRGATISLCLLVAASLARAWRSPVARIGAALMLGLVVQLVGSTPLFEAEGPRLVQVPFVAISVGNAVLFWLFVEALFDDAFTPRAWHLAAWLVAVLLGARNCATDWRDDGLVAHVAITAQHAVPLACSALAAWAAARTWRVDLVEKRRRLRGFIVVAGVVYTVATLFSRLSAPGGRVTGLAALLDAIGLFVMVAVVAFDALRLGPTELLPQRSPLVPAADPEPPAEPVDTRLASELDAHMRERKAYRAEGLTIAGLARDLGVPEYRLRRVINGQLGHRNFNAYVNGFRLDEACAALADPARASIPVLTIALEAGFQSIGPFNRAFKAATGDTPTAFRRKDRADS